MAKMKTAMPMDPDDKKWRAEDALRTLERAEEIRSDGALMKEVARCRDERMRALSKIKVETAPKGR